MSIDEAVLEVCRSLPSAQLSGDRDLESDLLWKYLRLTRGKNSLRVPRGSTVAQRFMAKLAFGASDCWYWMGARHYLGYGLMNAEGETKAHRISWILHFGYIPDNLMALHKCDVRSCVNPEHLFLGTQTDNMQDMLAKGRGGQVGLLGERNPMSKLSDADVAEMRRLRTDHGLSYRLIAERFGVVTMTALRAINRGH